MTRVCWTSGAGVALPLLVVMAACSGTPQTPTSPSAATGGSAAAAADGSTLKVTAPILQAPINGITLDSLRPTFSWSPATGSYVAVASPSYELHVLQGGNVIYTATTEGTSHEVSADAAPGEDFQWRVRARVDSAFGPWSSTGTFRTPDRPTAPLLPFTVPESCGPISNPPGNRIQCALDVAAVSPEWGRCQGGSGVGCHRFSRHVAAALAAGDPNWGLIGKNPGEQQCTWNRCGGLNGEGYGEDVVAYLAGPNIFNNWLGFDIVGGAGAPGATVGWGGPLPRRAGNYWAPVPSPIDQ